MNTIIEFAPAASERAWFPMPSIESPNAVPQAAPQSIHAMGSTYVLSTLGTGTDMGTAFDAVVPGARVRDAKQAAPPRGERH